LTYPLLADVDKKLAEKFGILNFMGIFKRTTFVISKKQKVIKIFNKVKVAGHAEKVVEYIESLDQE